MIKKKILNYDRIRHPGGRFSFIPHRFLLDGFFKSLSINELALYIFLTLASDKNGISYYGEKSICTHLGIAEQHYHKTLNALIERDLIAYDGRFFQVLELPAKPVKLFNADSAALSGIIRNIGRGGKND